MRNFFTIIVASVILALSTGLSAIMFFACECAGDAAVVNAGQE